MGFRLQSSAHRSRWGSALEDELKCLQVGKRSPTCTLSCFLRKSSEAHAPWICSSGGHKLPGSEAADEAVGRWKLRLVNRNSALKNVIFSVISFHCVLAGQGLRSCSLACSEPVAGAPKSNKARRVREFGAVPPQSHWSRRDPIPLGLSPKLAFSM